MLINRVPEDESGRAGDVGMKNLEDNSNELQTAEEIYQIMTKNNSVEGDGDKALTTRDLVILYKNLDIGTKLVPTANQQTSKSPNQYVETVIYNDEQGSEGSDISEDISNEDFNYVFTINEQRIDLINNFGDTLCHKFGDMQMHTADLTTEYDRHFLFNDSFIKEQLKSFGEIFKPKQSDSIVLPASLLDYICSKRIEDNYNFYMDNIIKYAQNTIEQLKRISNGDYLTEKAKEKWREIDGCNVPTPECKKTVLKSSVSIPLPVKDKCADEKSIWDYKVHSEMDVKSLFKIFEKKVIVEIPKIICGSYKLFSKRCKDNLIITCKKQKEPEEESRLDVVLKLRHSKSGHVFSNIGSIMVLKSLSAIANETETRSNDLLALEFKKHNTSDIKKEQENEMIEFDKSIGETPPNNTANCSLIPDREKEVKKFSEDDYDFSPQSDFQEDNYVSNQAEGDFNTTVTDELHSVIHRLSMQSPVIEESEDNMREKKPMRVRIKSPYENRSYVVEEKKRKRLLEIREKREIKKNTMSQSCKITKNRYGRSAVMVQASNSVTKLSITNKSFYNSIYGESINVKNNKNRNYHKDQTSASIPAIKLGDGEENYYKESPPPPLGTPGKNSQKYINRSYYLDEADTEVMYLQRKQNENQCLIKDASSTSMTASDVGVNFNLLKQLIAPSTTDLSLTDTSTSLQQNILCDTFVNKEKEKIQKNPLMSTQSTQVSAPENLQKLKNLIPNEYCKSSSSVECRKSIDKIYDLIKQSGKTDSLEVLSIDSKINIDKLHVTCGRGAQATDSGTSVKHHVNSSNPSCCSFGKVLRTSNESKNNYKSRTSVSPKIITMSSKSQSSKLNNKTNYKEYKLACSKISENPLKAISQLIHEFDNVQKTVSKDEKDSNRNKKTVRLTTEHKNNFQQNFLKRIPKQEQYLKGEAISTKNAVIKERRRRYSPFRITQQQLKPDESLLDTSRKNISDIIDEVKELRGEAVRGPSKKLARLNSLAQPKKAYLQAQQEESQNRFGKRFTDRLSRPPVQNPEKSIGIKSIRNKQKKISDELPTSIKQPHTAGSPSERLSRAKPPSHISPSRDGNAKRSPGPLGKPHSNHNNVNKTPENLKGKMVAVESYVKSHYGRESHLLELGNSHAVHKSRVPLIPNDLDLVSMASSPSAPEESTILGKNLHNMIDTMVNSTMPVLDTLTECNESVSKLGDGFDDISLAGRSKSDEIMSGSDYPVDIFEDKNIVTAVSILSQDHKNFEVVNNNISNTNICETKQPCPPNELQLHGKTSYHQITNGTFQKPLKIKKLTLNITPKKSVENAVVSQSGDTSSMVLKSKLSQHVDLKTDTLKELKFLHALSNNHINFGFTFPMQLTTVGYALPHLVKPDSTSKAVNSLKNEDSKLICIKSESCKNIMKNIKLRKHDQFIKSEDKKLSQERIEENKSDVCLLTDAMKIRVTKENYCERCVIDMQNKRKSQDNTFEIETTKDICDTDVKSSEISNSTSLDILVGLLNEIKNLTSYQAHTPKQENVYNTDDLQNKELEIIFNKVAAIKESSVDNSVNNVVSVPSLDNLQILEEHASNYIDLSSNMQDYNKRKAMSDRYVTTNTTLFCGPFSVDKEESAKVLQTEYIHRFTEVPSRFFPVSVSTNVTDSFIKLINKSSSRSKYSITDCESLNTSIANQNMEIPLNFLGNSNNNNNTSWSSPILRIQYSEKENIEDLKESNNHAIVEYDPLIKMKRDILVTVYSILVLTVFVALSFPEIMYRV